MNVMNGTKRKHSKCQKCERSDNYDDLVRCDHCDDWYHFRCAGVSREIRNIPWSCQSCLKFLSETYQQYKTTEGSAQLETRSVSTRTRKRLRHITDGNFQNVAAHLTGKKIEKLDRDKVEPTELNAENETYTDAADVDAIKLVAAATETIVQNQSDADAINNAAAITEAIVQDDTDAIAMASIVAVQDESHLDVIEHVAAVTETIVQDEADVDATAHPPDIMLAVLDVGSKAKFTNSEMESYLPVKRDEHLIELEYELIKNFDYLRQKHGKRGSEKLYSTMRIVSNSIIADEFLQKFSFKGQKSKTKQKLPLNVYPNVCTLIVLATLDAHNSYNTNISGFVKLTEEQVKDFFRNNFIKYASQRI